VELEFNLPGDWERRIRAIIADLRWFGLTTQGGILEAHGTRKEGYNRDQDGWRLEVRTHAAGRR
jgi:hypothetical protein